MSFLDRSDKLEIASTTRRSFFAGGHYVKGGDGGENLSGQIYVQCRSPLKPTRPVPIVLIHGGGQTGMNFETTPDGRAGWADYFVDKGYVVYIVDQPARGRSPYHADAQGPQQLPHSTKHVEARFTAPEAFKQWPQAHLHTQWPGTGRAGDPIFDQLLASQVSSIANREDTEQYMRAAGAALLDVIGPATILTHSQSGSLGWHIADARPELVKAVLAIEPTGPPFKEMQFTGAPDYFRYGDAVRPYGLTYTPIQYDPPVVDPSVDLVPTEMPNDDPELVHPYLQQEPARKLVNLARVPVLVLTSEASYHASYDHCTVQYLRQAGVKVTHVKLVDKGVRGNGHMMMLELNNLDVAQAICDWLEEQKLKK